MFKSARIKLTAWYLLIIMVISIAFSMVIYRVSILELERLSRLQRFRFERRVEQEWPDFGTHPLPPIIEQELIEETKRRLFFNLLFINAAILVISGGMGYFLSGKTLRPIKEMIDEQNRFITDASHELRTPLTSLKSEIEVNLRDKKLTLEEAKKLLASNLEEVNNLQILSDDLIKLTRYQKGDNGLVVAELSLTSIIEESVKKVANLAKDKNIKIVNKIKDFTLEGNRQTLVELIIIFLDNAIKYSPENTEVTLTSQKTDRYVLISIADQGIGVEEKDIHHLFDRFYRADKSRTKFDVAGYGLGLSIAKQVVDRHNGSIKVKSKSGEGTTFTVQLPLKHTRKLI